MLKLNASYAKKVPADSQFSSQSYHAQVEIELPDGMTQQQLREKAHNVFEFVRTAVESELQKTSAAIQPQLQQSATVPVQPNDSAPSTVEFSYSPVLPSQQSSPLPPARQLNTPPAVASVKQRNYLLALSSKAGWTLQQLLAHCRISSIDQIPSKLCSQLIQNLSGKPA